MTSEWELCACGSHVAVWRCQPPPAQRSGLRLRHKNPRHRWSGCSWALPRPPRPGCVPSKGTFPRDVQFSSPVPPASPGDVLVSSREVTKLRVAIPALSYVRVIKHSPFLARGLLKLVFAAGGSDDGPNRSCRQRLSSRSGDNDFPPELALRRVSSSQQPPGHSFRNKISWELWLSPG